MTTSVIQSLWQLLVDQLLNENLRGRDDHLNFEFGYAHAFEVSSHQMNRLFRLHQNLFYLDNILRATSAKLALVSIAIETLVFDSYLFVFSTYDFLLVPSYFLRENYQESKSADF